MTRNKLLVLCDYDEAEGLAVQVDVWADEPCHECATRGRDDACDGSVMNVHGAS